MANDFESLQNLLQRRIEPYAPAGDGALWRELPGAINRAIRHAQDFYNFPGTEATWSAVTTPLTRQLASFPADWKSPRGFPRLKDNTTNGWEELEWLPDEQEATRRWGDSTVLDTGRPIGLLYVAGVGVSVYPFPDALSDYGDGDYRITVPYYKYLPTLTTGSSANLFTTQVAEQFVIDAAFGFMLELLPGTGSLAFQYRLGDNPLGRPVSVADRSLKSLVRALKLRQVVKPVVLFPRPDVLGTSQDGRLGSMSVWRGRRGS